jgi:hypothetical protein
MIHCNVLGADDLLFGPAENAPRICFQAVREQVRAKTKSPRLSSSRSGRNVPKCRVLAETVFATHSRLS